jgi:hypothetical protein
MTVGEMRKAIEGVSDDMLVGLTVDTDMDFPYTIELGRMTVVKDYFLMDLSVISWEDEEDDIEEE